MSLGHLISKCHQSHTHLHTMVTLNIMTAFLGYVLRLISYGITKRADLTESLFQFFYWDIVGILPNNSIGNFPYLDQVILRCTTQDPGIIEIPAKVRYTIGVTSVHEKPGFNVQHSLRDWYASLTIQVVRLRRLQGSVPRPPGSGPRR